MRTHTRTHTDSHVAHASHTRNQVHVPASAARNLTIVLSVQVYHVHRDDPHNEHKYQS